MCIYIYIYNVYIHVYIYIYIHNLVCENCTVLERAQRPRSWEPTCHAGRTIMECSGRHRRINCRNGIFRSKSRPRRFQEGVRNLTEPAEAKRGEPFNSGTGRNLTRKRTRATTRPKNTGRTASNRGEIQSEPNRTKPVEPTEPNRNRTEPNRTVRN